MHLNHCKNNNEFVSIHNKLKLLAVVLFLTVGSFWLLHIWILSISAIFNLSQSIEVSIGAPLGGFTGLGISIWGWCILYTVVKTNRQTIYTWSQNKHLFFKKLLLSFLVFGLLSSCSSYFFADEFLLSKGYDVETKLSHINVYKIYTKESN